MRGDVDAALALLDKTGALSPDVSTKWSGLGNAFLQIEDWDELSDVYQQAIRIKPRSAEMYSIWYSLL